MKRSLVEQCGIESNRDASGPIHRCIEAVGHEGGHRCECGMSWNPEVIKQDEQKDQAAEELVASDLTENESEVPQLGKEIRGVR